VTRKETTILILSLPLSLLVIGVSCIGLLTPDFYSRESSNWQAQSIGQDLIDLSVIIPVLLISATMAFGGHRLARMIWAGVNVYLVYTFAIYAFDVHFNSVFLFYCICLGLAFYSIMYFLYTELLNPGNAITLHNPLRKVIGIYFIITAVLFYGLWLSDVLTAMFYNVPAESLKDINLPTNPVHVIDLSVILPGFAVLGVLLLRRHHLGFLLAPVMLSFTLLMNITIAVLNIVMQNSGVEANGMITIIMLLLAVFNVVLLFKVSQTNRPLHSSPHVI